MYLHHFHTRLKTFVVVIVRLSLLLVAHERLEHQFDVGVRCLLLLDLVVRYLLHHAQLLDDVHIVVDALPSHHGAVELP